MDLTTEFSAAYVGGDTEVHDEMGGGVSRGPIESAAVNNDWLHLRFKWRARVAVGRWQNMDDEMDLSLSVNLEEHAVGYLGDARICVSLQGVHMLILFPANWPSHLHPSQVQGLVLKE